jgi:hypothetical protein
MNREEFKQTFGKYPEEYHPTPDQVQKRRKRIAVGVGGIAAVGLLGTHPATRALIRGAVSGIRTKLFAIHPRLVELAAKIDLGDRQTKSDCMPCKPGEIRFPTLYIYGREEPIAIPRNGKALIQYRVRNRSMNQNQDEPEKYSTDIEVHSIEPIDDKDLKAKQPKEGEPAKLLEDVRKFRNFIENVQRRTPNVERRITEFARGDVLKRSFPELHQAGWDVQKRRPLQRIAAEALQNKRARKRWPEFMKGLLKPDPKRAKILERIIDFTAFDDPRPRNAQGEYAKQQDMPDANSMAAAYGPPTPAQPSDPLHIQRIKQFFTKRRAASDAQSADLAAQTA